MDKLGVGVSEGGVEDEREVGEDNFERSLSFGSLPAIVVDPSTDHIQQKKGVKEKSRRRLGERTAIQTMSRRKQARPIRHLESEDGLATSLPNGKYVTLHGSFFFFVSVCSLPRGEVTSKCNRPCFTPVSSNGRTYSSTDAPSTTPTASDVDLLCDQC